jgi:hypothetical protein
MMNLTGLHKKNGQAFKDLSVLRLLLKQGSTLFRSYILDLGFSKLIGQLV